MHRGIGGNSALGFKMRQECHRYDGGMFVYWPLAWEISPPLRARSHTPATTLLLSTTGTFEKKTPPWGAAHVAERGLSVGGNDILSTR